MMNVSQNLAPSVFSTEARRSADRLLAPPKRQRKTPVFSNHVCSCERVPINRKGADPPEKTNERTNTAGEGDLKPLRTSSWATTSDTMLFKRFDNKHPLVKHPALTRAASERESAPQASHNATRRDIHAPALVLKSPQLYSCCTPWPAAYLLTC